MSIVFFESDGSATRLLTDCDHFHTRESLILCSGCRMQIWPILDSCAQSTSLQQAAMVCFLISPHKFLISGGLAELHCDRCWCWVCNTPVADCTMWRVHQRATDKGPTADAWKAKRNISLRNKQKKGNNDQSPPDQHAFPAPFSPPPFPAYPDVPAPKPKVSPELRNDNRLRELGSITVAVKINPALVQQKVTNWDIFWERTGSHNKSFRQLFVDCRYCAACCIIGRDPCCALQAPRS